MPGYFAADAEQDWVWITPGSLGFRFFVVNFGNDEATYGAITRSAVAAQSAGG